MIPCPPALQPSGHDGGALSFAVLLGHQFIFTRARTIALIGFAEKHVVTGRTHGQGRRTRPHQQRVKPEKKDIPHATLCTPDVAARRRALPGRSMGDGQAQARERFVRQATGIRATRNDLEQHLPGFGLEVAEGVRRHRVRPGLIGPQMDPPWAQIRMLGQKKVIECIVELAPIARTKSRQVQRRPEAPPEVAKQWEHLSPEARSTAYREWCDSQPRP